MQNRRADRLSLYSKPIRSQKTKLARLFHMRPRKNPQKPGRALHVAFNNVLPLIRGFHPRYIYWVHFFKKRVWAGNHYHRKKFELFFPLRGEFAVHLQHIHTRLQEHIVLNEAQASALAIPTGIAHKVVAQTDNALLLVLASSPAEETDEIAWTIN